MSQKTMIKSQTAFKSALEVLVSKINSKKGIVGVSLTCEDYDSEVMVDAQWAKYKGIGYRDVYIFSNGLLREAHYKRERSILGFRLFSRGGNIVTNKSGIEEREKIEKALGLKVEHRSSAADEVPRVSVNGIALEHIATRCRHIKGFYGSTKIYIGRR